MTGNARSIVFNATAASEYKTESWIYGGRAFGTYGQTRSATTSALETSALAAGLQLRVDRRFSSKLSA